jgi:hypothetical protein
MNLSKQVYWVIFAAGLLSAIRLFGGEGLLPEDVRNSIARQHEVRMEVVQRDYREALDARFRLAEEDGDIDLMVLIADERDTPLEGDAPEELLTERDHLQAAVLRAERKRDQRILKELKLLRDGERAGDDLRAAIAELETRLAGPLLGPPLLPEDFFAVEHRPEWRFRLPYGRRENRSGPVFMDGEAVFTVHQEPDHFLLISRDLALLPEVTYHLSWEARSLRAVADEEETGEPAVYALGFGISDGRYRALLSAARTRLNRTVWEIAPAPVDSEWVRQEGTLRTGPEMNQFMIRTSTGTREWALRNLQIRRVY